MLHALLALLPLVSTADVTPDGGHWPGFRGRGNAVATARDLPVRWSAVTNVGWKTALPGYGQSSPVIWDGTVFVTAVDGPQRDRGFVLAYDARSGKKLWTHEFAPTQKAKWSNTVSRAAPTPAVDEAGVYAFFEGGDLLALSHAGKVRWSRSLFKEYGEFKNNHGLGASLAHTADAVFVLVDHQGPSYLLAVDKQTGKNLWKTDRKSRSSWTSPVVANQGGRPVVVVSSNGSVCGYDAKTGEALWELDGVIGNTLPSASASGDRVLVGAGLGRGKGDPRTAAKSNCCLKLTAVGGKSGYTVCWTAEKAIASYATPLAHRGHAYFVNQVGVVYCLDLQTGRQQYAERLDAPCWASPIGAGEYVYFFGKDGRTTVLKAGPTFEKVALNALWGTDGQASAAESGPGGLSYVLDPVVYGVAVADGAFFVRTGTVLYRIGKR